MLHFRRLLVNSQTEADTHLSDPRAIGGCVHRPSQSDISSCLSLSCQAAVSYLLCAWRKHERKEAAKLKCGGPELFTSWKNDRRVRAWCLRVAGGVRSKTRAAAGTKSNFVLITHPRCLRRVFSNKEFDLGRYYSYANFCL